MFYFSGSKCSKCEVELKETDDIVACPVCGSPHHRACYTENAGCANESLHEDGYSWKRDSAAEDEGKKAGNDGKIIYCGICGAENSGGRLYCHNCGKPLFDDTVNGSSEGSAYDSFNRQNYDFSDNEQINGVLLKDISRFIGGSGMLYAPLFLQMKKHGRKVCFNLIGLLFPALWYLNRKMYLRGILIILFNLISYCYSLLFYGVYTKIYEAAVKFDSDMVMEIYNSQPVIMGGFMGIGLLTYIIAIGTALFGTNNYMKWSVRKVKRLRARHTDDSVYGRKLDEHGRPGMGVALVILLAYFAILLVAEKFVPVIM